MLSWEHLTHWGRDKMADIFQTAFPNAFSWMKMYKFQLRFHWSLFPKVQLTIFQHIPAWRHPGNKPLSKPMMASLLTNICITWPQWVKRNYLYQDWTTLSYPHPSWLTVLGVVFPARYTYHMSWLSHGTTGQGSDSFVIVFATEH